LSINNKNIVSIITIGCAPDNKIVLSDLGIGRHHAEIHVRSNGIMVIIDLRSTNGTTVNGHSIVPMEKVLISRKDKILFAKTIFNWDFIVETSPKPDGEIPEGNLGSFMSEVFGAGDRFKSIKLFFSLLENTSDNIVQLSHSPSKSKIDPIEFFSIGIGLYLFNATYLFSILEEVAMETFLLTEWMLTLILAVSIFLAAVLNFNLFKLMTETKKKWINYFCAWLIFSGFAFTGFSLITFPFILIFFFDETLWHQTNKIIFTICLSINAFYCLVWVPLIWIKMNKKFWETTYFRVIFILIAILGITLLIYRFVVSYLEK